MKKINILVITGFIVIVLVPNLALAVWWNPFTWFVKKQVENPVMSQIDANSAGSNQISTPQDIKKVDEVKKDTPSTETKIVKKNIPQSVLISEFLKDPTLENFKVFCEKAKSLEGNKTKQVLSEDKKSLITQKDSMFNDFKECSYFNNNTQTSTGKESQFANYNLIVLDKNILVELKDNDSDWLREAKILYNNRVNELMNKSKIKFAVFKGITEAKTPIDLFNYYLDDISKWENREGNNTEIYVEARKSKIELIYKNISEFKMGNNLYE